MSGGIVLSFKHLEEKHGELILYLQKNGYSSGIISNIRTVIKDIINNADFNGWSGSDDYGLPRHYDRG